MAKTETAKQVFKPAVTNTASAGLIAVGVGLVNSGQQGVGALLVIAGLLMQVIKEREFR